MNNRQHLNTKLSTFKINSMKSRLFQLFITGIIIMLASCSGKENLTARFFNPLDIALQEEVVTISAEAYTDSIGIIPKGKLPVFVSEGDTLPSQCLDFDNDGKSDQVLVLVSMPAKSSKKVEISYVSKDKYPAFKARTNIRFARHVKNATELDTATRAQTADTEVTSTIFQMEGPAWENDKVGFRNYFDLRNGMDIFGKQTPEMVLDSVGLNRRIEMGNGQVVGASYHDISTWGMDVLKVANSLGAGSVALLSDDSLYRIGDNGYGTFKRLYEGPLQSQFLFSFPGWKAGNQRHNISQYVSITAGKYRYKTSLVSGKSGEGLSFVTGIVNKHSDSLYVEKISDQYTLLLTHAVQSEDTAMLSMALLIPTEELEKYGRTRDTGEGITETFYARLKTNSGVPVTYWFYSFWATGEPAFEDLQNVLAVIRKDVSMMEHPVSISRIK